MNLRYYVIPFSILAAPLMAQDVEPAAPIASSIQPSVAPISAARTENAVLRTGTPVNLRIMEEVTSSKKRRARIGQRFRMEVASPVYVEGVEVIPVGTPAEAEVTFVKKTGMWGKAGRLEARALSLRVNGRQIRLSGAFDDKGTSGTVGVVAAVALVPVAGFLVKGSNATLPVGGEVKAFIDEDVELAFASQANKPMQVPMPAETVQATKPSLKSASADPDPVVEIKTQ